MRTAFAILFMSALAGAQDAKSAEKALDAAVGKKDVKAVDAAAKALITLDSLEAIKALLTQASKGPATDDPFWMEAYWTLLSSAAWFKNAAALDELAGFILKNKQKPVGRDAMSMVLNREQKELVPLCLKILAEGPEDLRIMAAEHLAAVGDRSAIEPLLKALKANPAGELRKKIGRALSAVTGQDYGDNLTNWEGWWGANKEKDLPAPGEKKESTGTVTDTFDRNRSTEFEKLKKTGKVLILQAGDKCKCGKNHDLDNIDKVTTQMGLTTETVNKVDFEKDLTRRLDDYVAILANCTFITEHCTCPLCKPSKVAIAGARAFQCECPENKHDPARYVLGEKAIARIKRYVEGGGYVFAEDWCMEEWVQKAFPEFAGPGAVRKEEKVTVLPKAGSATHPYLKKIFFKPAPELRDTITANDLQKIAQTWKIDNDSRTIKIKDAAKVTVLLTSPELEKSGGDDAVAITFIVGAKEDKKAAVASSGELQQDRSKMSGGRVLYVLSHFGKQQSQDDEYSLQNLLINFLVEANERRGSYAPKK